MKILAPTTRTLGLVMALAMLHGPWALATDASRQPVTDAAPLMRQALAAIDGKASGVLTGESATAIGRRFQTQSPIHIDVRTERRYAQSGCARLKVLFWQDGVLLPGADKARRRSIEFGIDYCASGEPPVSLQ
tara:strand:+ start:835 stop:1233 length:399 start_codon:yes stop_codon:yes gene_type:complete